MLDDEEDDGYDSDDSNRDQFMTDDTILVCLIGNSIELIAKIAGWTC